MAKTVKKSAKKSRKSPVKRAKRVLKAKTRMKSRTAGKRAAKRPGDLMGWNLLGMRAALVAVPVVAGLLIWNSHTTTTQNPTSVEQPTTQAQAPAPVEAKNETPTKTETVAKVETPAAPEHKPTANKNALAKEFAAVQGKPIGERVAYWSNYLYQERISNDRLASLIHGPKIEDTAPFIPKTYDCTTFVETVSALAKSESMADFYKNVVAIRYKDSNPTYLSRNHFPEADWIPNNSKAGILRDVTVEIAHEAGIEPKFRRNRSTRANGSKRRSAPARSAAPSLPARIPAGKIP